MHVHMTEACREIGTERMRENDYRTVHRMFYCPCEIPNSIDTLLRDIMSVHHERYRHPNNILHIKDALSTRVNFN